MLDDPQLESLGKDIQHQKQGVAVDGVCEGGAALGENFVRAFGDLFGGRPTSLRCVGTGTLLCWRIHGGLVLLRFRRGGQCPFGSSVGTKQRKADAGGHQGSQSDDYENIGKHGDSFAEQYAFTQQIGITAYPADFVIGEIVEGEDKIILE